MMKCVFALALLHLCHSTEHPSNTTEMTNNITEMIDKLESLKSKPFKQEAILTFPGNIMVNHPASCMSPFKTGLRNLLGSLTDSDSEVVQTLRLKLETLEERQQNNILCPMKTGQPKTAFQQYKKFLQKYNNRRGQ